jgi:IS5 family transposase
MTPPQVLRSWIVMRIKNWDHRELRERIADGYSVRGFTEFFSRPVPKHDAFNRAFHRLTPQTLEAVNQMALPTAIDLWIRGWERTSGRHDRGTE